MRALTPIGYARALAAALERDELQKLVERLLESAADMEMRADLERDKILARRAGKALGRSGPKAQDDLDGPGPSPSCRPEGSVRGLLMDLLFLDR